MKTTLLGVMVATGLLIAGSALATDMPELAKKNHCTACHSIDKRLVGPAWRDVSRMYKGNAEAEAMLIKKVSDGGSGVWGGMPMAANDPDRKNQAQIKELVRFVLGLEK